MKNTIHKSIFIFMSITLGCCMILTSCKISKEEPKKREEAERNLEIEQNILLMSKKYDAVRDWEKQFKKISRSVYTIDLQKALIREDSRPILFFASIADIKKQKEDYLVYFDMGSLFDINYIDLWLLLSFPSIRFILKCTEEQVEKILNTKTEFLNERFAIVASIFNVEKHAFKLSASSGDQESSYIEVDDSDVFMAEGICLDLMFVGKYGSIF